MESWVGKLAESYFNEHREQAFAPNAEFVMYCQFGDARNVSIAELSYQLAVGFISYQCEGIKYEKLLVKYFEETASELGSLRGFVPFVQELNFFRTVLPIFDGLTSTSHLFVKLCASCCSATPSSNRNAILFEWPDEKATSNFDRIPFDFLDLNYRTLMVKRIAQFHAQSLHLKREHPNLFEKMNCAGAQQQRHFNVDLVRPMLVRNLQKLLQDSTVCYYPGISRLMQVLATLENHLRVPFSRSLGCNHCWVMCHQNYSQENVIFLSVGNEMPSDLKMFNCQSMGFASLGVDLVIPLFVEPGESIWISGFVKLVYDYHNELLINRVVGPSVKCIYEEIKNSIPFALYYLASRIVQAKESPSRNSLFEANWWKEELILSLYKYLIIHNFV